MDENSNMKVKGYCLKVAYKYDDEPIPLARIVADTEGFKFVERCQGCGRWYLTTRDYKNEKFCTACTGYGTSRNEIEHQKYLEYQRNRARKRRLEK